MSTIIQHITPAEYVTSQWGGGTTTQIAIAPAGAVYAQRTFDWRISSATVHLEESDFTPLPDYSRYLSLLQGSIRLTHNCGEELTLQPCYVHAFDGGDATHSFGTCVDFNLMLRKDRCSGGLICVHPPEDGEILLPRQVPFHKEIADSTVVIYCIQGGGKVILGSQTAVFHSGETLMLCQLPQDIRLHSCGISAFMVAEIFSC